VLESLFEQIGPWVREGLSTLDIENAILMMLATRNVESVFMGYLPDGHKTPYEHASCISINNEVIHGIPSKDRKLQIGDVVKIDVGFKDSTGLIYDGAESFIVPDLSIKDLPPVPPHDFVPGSSRTSRMLLKDTRRALEKGIEAAKAGNTTYTITAAIEAVAKESGLFVVEGYGGHGVGEKLHEPPFIANRAADIKGEAIKLTSGMRLAIEPMFATNSGKTTVDKNGWTVKVATGLAAHFERTIVVP